MDEFINIEDYKDFKNVTIAEYNDAKGNLEIAFINAIKQKNIKDALKIASLYIQIDKLLNKRLGYGHKYGYDGRGMRK